jgi:replication factor C subunit 3/5
MALLVDKNVPVSLAEVNHNPDVCRFLARLAHVRSMPHIIIHGKRGTGKKLFANLYLKEKYGSFETNSTTMTFKIKGKTEDKSSMHLLASRYHYQINPKNNNTYDRTLLKLFLGELSYNLISNIDYRIIIIEDADLLTIEAQESLRKTLETHINTCRFIFLSNNEGKIIDPLWSRCAIVRVNAPTKADLSRILTSVYTEEVGAPSPSQESVIAAIAETCESNILTAINYLECYLLDESDFDIKRCNPIMNECDEIINIIIKGNDITTAMEKCREKIYALVNYCVEHHVILEYMLAAALKRIPKQYHNERYLLCLKASDRDRSLRLSSKGIYHLEGFCLYIMNVIKDVMVTQKKKQTVVLKKKSMKA